MISTLREPLLDDWSMRHRQRDETSLHLLEGGEQQGLVPKGNDGSNKGCCARLISKKAMSADEVCMDLFNLIARDSEEVASLLYFQKSSKD